MLKLFRLSGRIAITRNGKPDNLRDALYGIEDALSATALGDGWDEIIIGIIIRMARTVPGFEVTRQDHQGDPPWR